MLSHLKFNAQVLWRLIASIRNWPIYFFHRFRIIRRGDVIFRLRNGMQVVARPFPIDKAVLNEVWFERCYEPNAFGVPFDWTKCRTIIDIGARLGAFTLYAADKAPGAHIHAYEPEPNNAGLLRRTIALSHLDDKVTLHEQAVGAASGNLTFYVSDSCSGWNSIYPLAEDARPITVPAISLQEMFNANSLARCDFMKIDCEGAEYDTIYSCPPAVLQKIAFIALEYHRVPDGGPTHTPDALMTYLRQQGFNVHHYKKYHVFAWRT